MSVILNFWFDFLVKCQLNFWSYVFWSNATLNANLIFGQMPHKLNQRVESKSYFKVVLKFGNNHIFQMLT